MNISWAFFQNSSPNLSLASKIRALRHDFFYASIADWRPGKLETFGNQASGCSWSLSPVSLTADSIVISAGAGRDISFELELVDRIGCRIVLLDPSETGLETMQKKENRHPNIEFIPKALSSMDEPIYLMPPLDSEEGSWRLCTKENATVTVPAVSLATLMKERGILKIDLLKMDIEGSEYPVVDSIVEANLPIQQICVEYHNAVLPGYSRSGTIGSLLKLWRKGYRIIHKGGSNHTLRRQKF